MVTERDKMTERDKQDKMKKLKMQKLWLWTGVEKAVVKLVVKTIMVNVPSPTLYGMSWYWSRKVLSWPMQMFRSPSLNS